MRATPHRPLRALCLGAAGAAIASAGLAASALGAEGGPGLNTVPAAGSAATPPVTVTAAKPLTPAPTATTPLPTPLPGGHGTAPVTPAGGGTITPGATSTVPPAAGSTVTGAAAPARARGARSGGISDAALALAIAAALLALCALAWALARLTAYQPRWTLSMRHSMAEAGYRASATWAELRDWMRLGR